MNELFLEELDDFIINQDNWTIKKSIKDFWGENYQNIIDSEVFLLSKLQEYAPSNNGDFSGFFYRYLYFFLFKDEKKYNSKKIVDFLKKELIEQSNTEKPEFYSNILSVIFKIEGIKSKDEFYQNQYKNINEKGYLYSDISTSFLEIFIQLGINNGNVLPEFSDLFPKVIIQSVDEIISSSIQDGWDYLISLEENNFNREFINLINYFNTEEIRGKLVHHHKYTSLFTLGKYEDDTKKFNNIRLKIEKSFGTKEYEIYERFIISEVNYVLGIHERAIEKNIFISQGIEILQKYNCNFIIKLLNQLNTESTYWGLENTIVKYLQINQIEDFINILKDTDNSFTIFRVYETLKEKDNTSFIEAFEESSYKDELQKIQKQRDEIQDKNTQENEKRICKEKDAFLSMITGLEEGQYYPKLFEDYAEYCSSNNTRFSIYTEKEKLEINNEIIRQIRVYLSYRKVEEYTNKSLDYVTFEKKEENSYSHCWDVRYMTWFLEIAQKLPELKKILKENYKSILLFYPLMYTYQTEEFFFNEILSDKIEKDDIEYILRAYNSNLHENAKDLRYYHPSNFSSFYNKFKNHFSGFEKQLENISFQMIHEKEKVDVYHRETYLEIYADSVGESKYRKYWNKEKKKNPDFNYFNDILKNEHEKTGEELKEMRFYLMIQTVLIEKYAKKSDIIWRIEQFKGFELKYTSRLARKYPHYSGVTSWSGEGAFSEIEWSSFDRENFAYIFSLDIVGKIDVSKNMLEILEESLKIKAIEDKEQVLYANYLQKIFFKYFEFFNESHFEMTFFEKFLNIFGLYNNFYEKILRILGMFDVKYTYNFNINFFKQKLSKSFIKTEAKKIIKNKDYIQIETLLDIEKEKKKQKINNENGKQETEKNIAKYIVFVEGNTDKVYIEKAAEKLGEIGILKDLEIRTIGINNDKGSCGSNDLYLKYGGCFLSVNKEFIPEKHEKIVFLHDPENGGGKMKISETSFHNECVWIKLMKKNKEGIVDKGIEALFNKNTLDKAKSKVNKCFKTVTTEENGNKHKKYEIIQGQKTVLCNWICNNGKKNDFEGFQHIFHMLKEIIED